MTNNDKDEWRKRWLYSINELTSFDLQKKSWLNRTHTNPHWSFVEFMCCYFDDLVIDDNYKYQFDKGWVTSEELEIIKAWHEALDKYDSPKNEDYNHEAILKDPKWLDILQIGVKSKHKLAEIVSESEKQILIEEVDYLKFV